MHTGCTLENLTGAINDRDGWGDRVKGLCDQGCTNIFFMAREFQ